MDCSFAALWVDEWRADIFGSWFCIQPDVLIKCQVVKSVYQLLLVFVEKCTAICEINFSILVDFMPAQNRGYWYSSMLSLGGSICRSLGFASLKRQILREAPRRGWWRRSCIHADGAWVTWCFANFLWCWLHDERAVCGRASRDAMIFSPL